MGEAEVTAFLNHLSRERKVASSTQNQALSAIVFLYKEVLGHPLGWLEGLEWARRPARVPTVLTAGEVQRLLAHLEGTKWLMASLLYGAGLRLRECLKLRVKDIDFEYRQIVVRDGKGAKDRVTVLPAAVVDPLKLHLIRVKALHEKDLADGYGDVGCRARWSASIHGQATNGRGSSCFRPSSLLIPEPALSAAITSSKIFWHAR